MRNLHRRFDWHYIVDKSTVEISQNFVAFSEYMNFMKKIQNKTVENWVLFPFKRKYELEQLDL